MKIVTRRDDLQHAIATVQRAVSTRSTLPILSNVLLVAEGDALTLGAYDLEIGVQCRMDKVEVERGGRTTINARLFAEVVAAQPADLPLVIESDDNDQVTFQAGRSVLEVHGLPADEFPAIPAITGGRSVSLAQGTLKRVIQQCAIAVSTDETRARLTGMFLKVEDRRLRLVATDTHRLATRSVPLTVVGDEEIAEIVPGRAMREVERLLSDDEEATVSIDFSDNQAQFRIDGVTLITRLIEGEFPNYRKVIPASHEWTVTVETTALRESVRRCAIVSREDNRKMVLRASPAGQLQLAAESSKVGRADQELDQVTVQVGNNVSESLEIAFNADYLLQALMQIAGDELVLELTGPGQPGAVRPLVEDDDYVYVLMPMQL